MRIRRLVDFPYVLVRLRCDTCKRAGAYRLARLAEKYGAEILVDDCPYAKKSSLSDARNPLSYTKKPQRPTNYQPNPKDRRKRNSNIFLDLAPDGLPLIDGWHMERSSPLEPFDDRGWRNSRQFTMRLTEARVIIARHESYPD